MNRKITLVLMIVLLATIALFAEKSFERLGNEAEFAGDELYNAKDYAGAIAKYDEAEAKFNEAATKDQIPVEGKLAQIDGKLFKAYYFSEDYENAIKMKKKILVANPKDSRTARIIAQIYQQQMGSIDSAINFLIEYDSANPNTNSVIKKIASYYKDKEDFTNAIKWYRKSYAIKQNASIIKNIAVMHNNLGQTEEAINAYEDFIKTNPGEDKVRATYSNMGALYEEMNENSKAALQYEKSNNMQYDKNLTIKLITLYHDMGSNSKAKENISKLLANDAGNELALYYRGLIAYENGDKVAAKADFLKLKSSRDYGKSATGYITSIDSE